MIVRREDKDVLAAESVAAKGQRGAPTIGFADGKQKAGTGSRRVADSRRDIC